MTTVCRSTIRRSSSHRVGMTLVEMLVTITIIALLTSMVLMGIAGATQQAKEKRTQAQIAKLHEIIMERWRSYETRRPPVVRPKFGDSATAVQTAALVRLAGIRELMRMELPDRISDVVDGPVVLVPHDNNGVRLAPSLSAAYLAQATANTQYGEWTQQFQGAECLYLIVANTFIDETPALQYFNENEIGDIDNDGMREILDGWGMPIQFLRWAPGFISPIQTPNSANPSLIRLPQGLNNQAVTTFNPYISQTTDPFDPMHVDPRDNFALIPLLFSAGPDKQYNIQTNHLMKDGGAFRYVMTDQEFGSPFKNDPYVELPDSDPADSGDYDSFSNHFGQVDDTSDDGHVDNISNHFLEAR